MKTPTMLTTSSRMLRVAGALGALGVAALLAPHARAAEFNINVDIGGPPPPPRHEVMVAAPGPGYVWVGGYWDGDPGHYRWVGGHWERPPHPGARWVAPRYEHRGGRYVRVGGGWR